MTPRHLLALVAGAGAVAGAFGAAPAAAARATVPDGGIVIVADPPDALRQLRQAAQAGASWVSLPVGWEELEPADGALDPVRLGMLTETLRYAKRLGLHTMVGLADAPGWASGREGRTDDPPSPANLPAYGRFIGDLARTQGALIDAYVPWNEPNLTFFWNPVDPVAYAKLQVVAYDAVKAADPTALVLSAGIAGGHETAYSYLRRAYAAGLRRHVDVVAWHAYPAGPPEASSGDPRAPSSSLAGQIRLRKLLDRIDRGRPIWITELGWSTCTDCRQGAANSVGLAQQADYLQRAFVYRRRYLSGSTERIFWFRMDDAGGPLWEQSQGLVRANLSPKPAYRAFAALRLPGRWPAGARVGRVPTPALPASARRTAAGPAGVGPGGVRAAIGPATVMLHPGRVDAVADVRLSGGRVRLDVEAWSSGAWRRAAGYVLPGSARVHLRVPDHGVLGLRLTARAVGGSRAVAVRVISVSGAG